MIYSTYYILHSDLLKKKISRLTSFLSHIPPMASDFIQSKIKISYIDVQGPTHSGFLNFFDIIYIVSPCLLSFRYTKKSLFIQHTRYTIISWFFKMYPLPEKKKTIYLDSYMALFLISFTFFFK